MSTALQQAAQAAAAKYRANYAAAQQQNTSPPPVTSSTSVSAPYVPPVANAVLTAQQKRQQEVAYMTFSNVPEIAAIQRLAQQEYIATGVWNDKYTKQADDIRLSLNPMMPEGTRGFGENRYILGGEGTAFGNFLSGLFGGGKDAVSGATDESRNGTVMLVIFGVLGLFLLRGR